MRHDLQESLEHSHIDPADLSTFQRILLTTDGTVTDMLEAYFSEPIQLIKLTENKILAPHDIPVINLKQNTEIVERKILLQGKISRRNYLYAESILILERLEPKFRQELLETKTPLGKIWLDQKVETFKEIINTGKHPAQKLAEYFKIKPEDNLLFRTYYVLSGGKATIMITEKFPEAFFK
jgi:chorismate-pyruvate lyase